MWGEGGKPGSTGPRTSGSIPGVGGGHNLHTTPIPPIQRPKSHHNPHPSRQSLHVGVAAAGPDGSYAPCTEAALPGGLRAALEQRQDEEEAKMAEGGCRCGLDIGLAARCELSLCTKRCIPRPHNPRTHT